LRKGVTLGGLTIRKLIDERLSVSRFVLDNTVTMAWCFVDEADELTETLLSRLSNVIDSAIVPALWLYEVVTVTELAVRKGRTTAEKANSFPQASLTSRSK